MAVPEQNPNPPLFEWEMDALPTGSVVLNTNGRAWIRRGDGLWTRPLSGSNWKIWDSKHVLHHAPVTLLHRGWEVV